MKFIRINAGNRSQPELKTKSGYAGAFIDSKTISKKQNLLITGNHHSGKTRAIRKLYESAEQIWRGQLKPYKFTRATVAATKPMLKPNETAELWQFPAAVFICGSAPMSKWLDHQGVADWWDKENEPKYAKIPAWKRCELLPKYLRATRAVLFVDDADKLTGRKLVIAKECIDRAYRVVIACTDENRLSPSIRRQFLETKPQEIRLTSEVAYDATHVLVWLFVAFAMFAGSPELAALIGVFELMKGGRRASKQD
ncbi:MAG: hypothetical protein WCI06_08755 [Methylococcaceae bacterium]